MRQRIRIVNSSGHPMLTQVLDAETGEDLTQRLQIQRIVIDIDIRLRSTTATLTCAEPGIEVVAEAEFEAAAI